MRPLVNQRVVSVPTTGGLLISGNVKRQGLVISAPRVSPVNEDSSNTVVNDADTSAAATVATNTIGTNFSRWIFASCVKTAGADPTMALRYTSGGVVIDLLTGVPPLRFDSPIIGTAGDTLTWVVTAGGAASTCDLLIVRQGAPTPAWVELATGRIPADEEGIKLFPGNPPLLLNSILHGDMLADDIFARARGGAITIVMWEILTP